MWLYYLKKAWIWIKKYWYIPIAIVVGLVSFFAFGFKNNHLIKYFKKAKKSYKEEIESLQLASEAYNTKKDKLIEEHSQKLEDLDKEHEASLNKLEAEKNDKIKSNPGTKTLADSINNSLGLK